MPMTLSSAEVQSARPPDDASQKADKVSRDQAEPAAFEQEISAQTAAARVTPQQTLQHRPAAYAKAETVMLGAKAAAHGDSKAHVDSKAHASDVQETSVTTIEGAAAPAQQPSVNAAAPAIEGLPGQSVSLMPGGMPAETSAISTKANGSKVSLRTALSSRAADQPHAATAAGPISDASESAAPTPVVRADAAPPMSHAEPSARLMQAITSAVHTLPANSAAPAAVHHGGLTANAQTSAAEAHTADSPEQLAFPQMEPHAILSGAGALEIGMGMGTHGWLRVRASMADDGSVATQLVTTSAASAQKLEKDLPALSAYLAEQQIAVSSTVVHAVEHAAAAQNVLAGDASPAFNSAADAQREQQQGDPHTASAQAPHPATRVAVDYGSLVPHPAQGLLAFGPAAAGGWLSVRV